MVAVVAVAAAAAVADDVAVVATIAVADDDVVNLLMNNFVQYKLVMKHQCLLCQLHFQLYSHVNYSLKEKLIEFREKK